MKNNDAHVRKKQFRWRKNINSWEIMTLVFDNISSFFLARLCSIREKQKKNKLVGF